MSNIYSPSKDDPFFNDLKEWCKNNPLTKEELEKSNLGFWHPKNFGFQKGVIPWNKGKSPSEETKIKCGLAAKRKVVTEKMRENYSQSKLGEKNPNYGKPLLDSVKEKLRQGMLNRKMPKISNWHKNNDHHTKHVVVCPHCNKKGKSLAMNRWHFNNCKNYSSSSS